MTNLQLATGRTARARAYPRGDGGAVARSALGRTLAVVLAGALLTGCGSRAEPAAPAAPSGTAAEGGCPLAVTDLVEATSLTWELREKLDDHPLETNESIKVTACLYTAADAPQEGADPLVMRVDVATGEDVAIVRKDFTDTCAEYDGSVRDSAGSDEAIVCDRAGVTVEGLVGGAGRVVNVYLVNADKPTAAKLTPTFDAILAAVR